MLAVSPALRTHTATLANSEATGGVHAKVFDVVHGDAVDVPFMNVCH